jgi:hypothetical protein
MATKKTTKKASRSSTKDPKPTTRKRPAAKDVAQKPARQRAAPDSRLPAVGTVLTRTYKGQQIKATVVEGGVKYEGEVYRSISGLARHIVGYQISGPVFFKLTGAKAAEGE